jgi:hypothetical protein
MTASLSRRGFSLSAVALLLTACGDSEGAARTAFISFLKERVIAPRGLRIPRLSDEETRRFGPYAGHYAVIRNFHDTLTRDVTPLTSNAARVLPALRRPQDWTARRGDVAESRKLIGFAKTRSQDLIAQTQEAAGRLSLPPDLKPVFDDAFRKTVTEVAPVFLAFVDGLDDLMFAIDAAGAYIDGNLTRMRLVNGMFETSDATVLSGLQERSSAIAGAQARLFQVRQKLDALMGSA